MTTDNEMTIVDSQTKDIDVQQQDKNNSDTWRKVAIGGVTGILLGASGAAVASTLNNQTVEGTSEEQTPPTPNNEIDVATGVRDSMSFGDAFAAARSEVGPGGVFHWRGNVYNTYYEKEWNEMSHQDRVAFSHRAAPEIAHSHTHHHESHHDHAANTHAAEVETAMSSEDPDVRLIGVQDVTMEDGSVQTIGAATVNGYDVVLVDMDHNGVFDYAGVDVNNNGQIDPDERIEIASSHITVNSFSREAGNDLIIQRPTSAADSEDTVVTDTQQEVNDGWANGDDLPDYTNDSDLIG